MSTEQLVQELETYERINQVDLTTPKKRSREQDDVQDDESPRKKFKVSDEGEMCSDGSSEDLSYDASDSDFEVEELDLVFEAELAKAFAEELGVADMDPLMKVGSGRLGEWIEGREEESSVLERSEMDLLTAEIERVEQQVGKGFGALYKKLFLVQGYAKASKECVSYVRGLLVKFVEVVYATAESYADVRDSEVIEVADVLEAMKFLGAPVLSDDGEVDDDEPEVVGSFDSLPFEATIENLGLPADEKIVRVLQLSFESFMTNLITSAYHIQSHFTGNGELTTDVFDRVVYLWKTAPGRTDTLVHKICA